jgi:protein phosphatase
MNFEKEAKKENRVLKEEFKRSEEKEQIQEMKAQKLEEEEKTQELEEKIEPIEEKTLLSAGDTLKHKDETLKVLNRIPADVSTELYEVESINTQKKYILFASKDANLIKKNFNILSSLQSSSFPKPLFIGEDKEKGIFYFLTDYFEVRPLNEDELKNLSLKDFFILMLNLIMALKELHSKGYVLTSLRPQIISMNKPVKILELTYCLKENETLKEPLYFEGYTAPELQKKDEVIDRRADIYSLGALIHLYFLKEKVSIEEGFNPFFRKINFSGIPQLLAGTLSENKDERFYSTEVLHKKLLYLKNEFFPSEGYDIFCKSIIGLNPMRTINEDAYKYSLKESFSYEGLEKRLIGAVADGMGGMEKGEIASSEAVKAFIEYVEKNFENYDDKNELLKEGIRYANEQVVKALEGEKGGTTIVGFILVDNILFLGNVGDSRAYLVNEEGISLLTNDHSYAWYMLQIEGYDREEIIKKIRQSEDRNSLIQSLGIKKEINITTLEDTIGKRSLLLKKGDTLILCTDGVWDEITEQEIYEIVKESKSSKEIGVKIIEKVLERGAPDNATVLVVKI